MKIDPTTFYDKDYFYPNFKEWTDEFGVTRKYYGPSKDWSGFFPIAKWIHENIQGRNLFDIGCSAGSFVAHASEFFDCRGCDISKYAIDNCVDRAKRKLMLLDIANSPPPGKFDIVTSMDLLEHIYENQLDRVLGFIRESMNPGGSFFSCICTSREPNQIFIHTSPNDEIPPDKRWLGVAGHVNIRPMTYWIEKLNSIGIKADYEKMWKFQIWRLLDNGMRNLDSWSTLNVYIGKLS